MAKKPVVIPGIVDADDYWADTPKFLQDAKRDLTPEKEYEDMVRRGKLRNLLMEADLDMTKVDADLLKEAKVWVDEQGNYHPEVLRK